MTWTTPADLKLQVQKLWDRGEILRATVNGHTIFPYRLRLKHPTSTEMIERIDDVHSWIGAIRNLKHYRLEMREFRHRVFGKNMVPSEVWIDSIDDALLILNKRRDANRFAELVKQTREDQPDLLSWLERYPLRGLELEREWTRLLQVVNWMRLNPKPTIYLRQVDLPGVHSKFIETQKAVLTELFDHVLPIERIDATASGSAQFARRFGFLDKPLRVRFRILDPAHSFIPNSNEQDITLDCESFSKLNPRVSRVFVTENEINFLAFPKIANSMVVFGGGYGLEGLVQAPWLLGCEIFYWGDLDTHGFAILNSVRHQLPHTRSFLMDEKTLHHHKFFWGFEEKPSPADRLPLLTDEEHALYKDLRNNRWHTNLRLEQEHIGWAYACEAISALTTPSSGEAHFTQTSENDSALSVQLSAADIYNFFRPSECGRRVYLQGQGLAEDSQDPYTELLKRLGMRHEKQHTLTFAAITDLSSLSYFEQIQSTNRAVTEKHDVIYKPLLAVTTNLAGVKVTIVGSPDLLIFDESGYAIRDIKIARRFSQVEHPELVLQMQLYGWLYKQMLCEEPLRLEVLNGANQLVTIANDGGKAALRLLIRILNLKQNQCAPYSPVGWSKCSGCLFNEYCWAEAQEQQDVSLVPGVDQGLALALHRCGGKTVHDLVSNFDQESLSTVQRAYGDRNQKVGKKSVAILRAAEAMLSQRETVFQRPDLPASSILVMVDFEGLPPYLDQIEKVDLWGTLVVGEADSQYSAAIAGFGEEGDKEAWEQFLKTASAIFTEYGDVPFVHWHQYETVQINRYIQRFGDLNGIASRVLNNCLDLLRVFRECVAMPLTSYSLKVIERFIGVTRSQEQYGGTWAMAKYIEATESGDDEQRKVLIEQIVTYNREDLESTKAAFHWLQEKSSLFCAAKE